MPAGLRVVLDARPLDIDLFATQGIGRYAHGLIGPLREVAAERGGELVLLRARRDHDAAGATSARAGAAGATLVHSGDPARATPAYAGDPTAGASQRVVLRPPLPERLADWPEQLLLPFDLRRTGAHVAHALSIYRSAVFPGVPSVMTMLDVVPLMWPELYLKTGIGHRVLYAAARRARLVLAISETVRRDAISHLRLDPRRVLTVPLAADERFRPADPGPARARLGLAEPYLLYLGGLATADPRKNLEGLVDAYARWRREEGRPEVLVLAGREGEASRALVERASRAGAPLRVTGFVPDEELPGLISGARCLVTASRYEGFGLPALEAVSCATPVVAFDAGALPEVAGPGGLVVPDGDGAELMRAAGRMCDQPELRERLSREGLRHSRGYTWRRTAELTWGAYERVAAPARAQ